MAEQKPQRTCIVCRTTETKNSLLRLVRSPEGEICFDPTGKMNGRGAYVCSVACLEKALSSKKLDAALRTTVTAEDRERIAQQLRASLSHEEK